MDDDGSVCYSLMTLHERASMQDLRSAVLPLAAFLGAFSILAVALYLARKLSGWLEHRGLGRKEKTSESDESYSMLGDINPSASDQDSEERYKKDSEKDEPPHA